MVKLKIAIVITLVLGVVAKIWIDFSPDVRVWVEGTYTENDVNARIYTDIELPCLTDFGVQLLYHTQQLRVENVVGNDELCYFENHSSYLNYERLKLKPYNLREIDRSFDTIYFVGNRGANGCNTGRKSDSLCIFGNKILIGEVDFKRTEHSMPFNSSLIYITFSSNPEKEFRERSMDKLKNNIDDTDPLKPNKIRFGPVTINESG